MSRNRKRIAARRKRRFSRRKRQAPLHIPSVQIQPWRRITLVLETTGAGTYQMFNVDGLRKSLAGQTTLTIDTSHPFLIKISRIRVWNQGQKSILGPLGLMPLSLINTNSSREPLMTFEDHPVGLNPARAQYTWPRLHQQVIFHTEADKQRLVFGIHANKDDHIIVHLVVAYKPEVVADFVMYSGSAPSTSLRDMEML